MNVLKIKDPNTGQWITIPGLRGEIGPQGEQGPQGERGPNALETIKITDDGQGNVILTWFDYEDGNEVEY